MAPLFPALLRVAAAAAALLAFPARAYVMPDVSAETPAGCRCMIANPTAATAGSFLAGTQYGCGPHPDPTGTFAYPAQWCLVDQTPALLVAAGGSCGQKVAGLGNVSACAGASISGVSVAPSQPLAASQPATTFYLGQTITATWTQSGIVQPGEGVYVALQSATGVILRIGGQTAFANATAGTFTTPAIGAALVALAQPVTAMVLQCRYTTTITTTCQAFNSLPNANSTTVQPGLVGVSTQQLTLANPTVITDILDNNGISYLQVHAAPAQRQRSAPAHARASAPAQLCRALRNAFPTRPDPPSCLFTTLPIHAPALRELHLRQPLHLCDRASGRARAG